MCAFGPICRRLCLIAAVLVASHGMLTGLPHSHCVAVHSCDSDEAVSAADHGCHDGEECLTCSLAAVASATLTGTVMVGQGGWNAAASPAPLPARDPGLSPLLRARSPPSRLG